MSPREARAALAEQQELRDVAEKANYGFILDNQQLRSRLNEVRTYCSDRADVNDGDYGHPEPNDWMRLAQIVEGKR